MALGHKYAGFKRTNWENKSPKQKAEALKKQYINLGLKVPAYLNGGVTPSNFERAYNRIENSYERKIDKARESKDINLQVKNTILKFNKTVANTIKGLEKMGFSKDEISYLSGKELHLHNRKKSYISTGVTLKEINEKRVRIENTRKAKRDFIKMIEEQKKTISLSNIKKTITKGELNAVEFMKEFLNEDYFISLSETNKNHLMKKFENLSYIQKEIVIKLQLNDLRDKYKGMNEEDLADDTITGIYNKINYAIMNIKDFGKLEEMKNAK